MARIGTLLTLLLLTLVASFLFADAAFAIGDGTVGNFSCSNGNASGQLYVSSTSCPASLEFDHLFSFLVCNMEQLSSNLMGHMYCGMIVSLTPMVWAAITLAVVIFGISFTFGIIPLKGGEAIKFLLKLSLIAAFATKADYLVGVGYQFLILGIKDGIKIALDGMAAATGTGAINSADGVYDLMDQFLAKAFHMATDGVSATNGPDRCKNAVFAVMATMAAAFPMLSYLGLVLIGRIAITFFRGVFGYVYALVGITFLMTLAPFFLTFALFKQTHEYFDKWISYIVSFALQMILLFAFLAFVMMLKISNMTNGITNIIMYDAKTVEATSIRLPWQYCTLCDFTFVDNQDHTTPIEPGNKDFIAKAEPQCKMPKKPIALAFAVAPPANPATGGATTTTVQSSMNSLIELAGTGLISLIVLAIMVERLLAMIPYLSQRLAAGLGANYAAQLGGGSQAQGIAMRMPGESVIDNFETGFRRSMATSPDLPRIDPVTKQFVYGGSGDGISRSAKAIMSGVNYAVVGEKVREADGNIVRRGGIGNDLTDWLVNTTDPNRGK